MGPSIVDVDKAPGHFIEPNKLVELLLKPALILYLEHYSNNQNFIKLLRDELLGVHSGALLAGITNNRTNEAARAYKSEIEYVETFNLSIAE